MATESSTMRMSVLIRIPLIITTFPLQKKEKKKKELKTEKMHVETKMSNIVMSKGQNYMQSPCFL